MSDGTSDAWVSSVFVSGSDVYAVGSVTGVSSGYTAKLWKNGVATNLTDGITNGYAKSVFITN